jgi:hypothetical protein
MSSWTSFCPSQTGMKDCPRICASASKNTGNNGLRNRMRRLSSNVQSDKPRLAVRTDDGDWILGMKLEHRYSLRMPEYRAWRHMRYRCNNPNCHNYANYGGRGIRISNAWGSFIQFIADVGLRPSPKHTLDRIDNNGHYEPGNVRWADHYVQNRNKRSNRMISHAGRTYCATDWARIIGLDNTTILDRLDRGYPIEVVLSPLHLKSRRRKKESRREAAVA